MDPPAHMTHMNSLLRYGLSLALWWLLSSTYAFGQDSLYINPTVKPTYPTGDIGFYEDLTNQISQQLDPYLMRQMAPGGYQAIIGFVVNPKGIIDSVFHDNRSTHYFLDTQLGRAFRQTQPWQPGIDHGDTVSTLIFMEFYLTGSDPVWHLAYQPLYPNSVILANRKFDKKWTKWAILGVIATVGLFYLLMQL